MVFKRFDGCVFIIANYKTFDTQVCQNLSLAFADFIYDKSSSMVHRPRA